MERTEEEIGCPFNRFCWIKALFVRLDHYRAVGCRIGGDSGPGEMDVIRRKSHRPVRGSLPQHKASGTHSSSLRQLPTSGGGGLGFVIYPVDDFHQVRITMGIEGWGFWGSSYTRWTTSTRPGLQWALRDGDFVLFCWIEALLAYSDHYGM